MRLNRGQKALRVQAVHFADQKPYVYEDRWVNTLAVPAIKTADLTTVSANEWLVAHASYTDGDIAFSAANIDADIADILKIDKDDAVFVIERNTWANETAVTSVTLTFAPGYRMHTAI